MRPRTLLPYVCVLVACAALPPNMKPPPVDDFPKQELLFRISGDVQSVLQDAQDNLASRPLPSETTLRSPVTYLVTAFLHEPSTASDSRLRITAFRLGSSRLERPVTSPCTAVAVSSLTKSHGRHEEKLSVHTGDESFVSSKWPELKAILEKRPCK